jgi:1,2-diacylglycerol 3-alpha-glucosyltransferase
MHVLMISLDASLLGEQHGDPVLRHLEYARRIGQISMVVYNPAAQRKTAHSFADNLTVYPTNTHPILFPWAAYRAAARVHRERPVDVISTQEPFACGLVGLLLKRRFGLPLNMQNHSSFFSSPHWAAERPLRNHSLLILAKIILRFADTHRVVNESEKRRYLALGIPESRIIVLSVPTPLDLFIRPVDPDKRAALRASLGIDPAAPVLLWVGKPAAVKNIDLLLAAFELVYARRPDVRLVLVGDFSERPDFVRRAQAAGIIFTGRVDHVDLPSYYQLADLYVHSSRYEGFSRVLVEALVAGTPVVATRNDGPVRDGETGLLTDHTAEALSAAILTLLNNPTRRQQMGETGQRDMLERFDYARQLDAVANVYRRTAEIAHGKL